MVNFTSTVFLLFSICFIFGAKAQAQSFATHHSSAHLNYYNPLDKEHDHTRLTIIDHSLQNTSLLPETFNFICLSLAAIFSVFVGFKHEARDFFIKSGLSPPILA